MALPPSSRQTLAGGQMVYNEDSNDLLDMKVGAAAERKQK